MHAGTHAHTHTHTPTLYQHHSHIILGRNISLKKQPTDFFVTFPPPSNQVPILWMLQEVCNVTT